MLRGFARLDEFVRRSPAYDCHDTDKLDYFNPVNGVVVWRRECKSKPRKSEWWVDAALAQDAPRDLTAGMPFGVIGRVEHAGPKWKLASASVVDLEKTRAPSPWRPDEIENIDQAGKIGVEKH
jgi:hypothetical protein